MRRSTLPCRQTDRLRLVYHRVSRYRILRISSLQLCTHCTRLLRIVRTLRPQQLLRAVQRFCRTRPPGILMRNKNILPSSMAAR